MYIEEGDDLFHILKNVFRSFEIELISNTFRKSDSSYCEYVLEIMDDDVYTDENGKLKPVPKELVGFWTTGEIIMYNSEMYDVTLKNISQLYKARRIPITQYRYEMI